MGHRIGRTAGHHGQLPDDERLRHAADGGVELSVQPVPARTRPGQGRSDRPIRKVDRHALPLRAEHRRRREDHAATTHSAATSQGRPQLAGNHRVECRPVVDDGRESGYHRRRTDQSDQDVPRAFGADAGQRDHRRRLGKRRQLVCAAPQVPRLGTRLTVGDAGNDGPGGAVRHRGEMGPPRPARKLHSRATAPCR